MAKLPGPSAVPFTYYSFDMLSGALLGQLPYTSVQFGQTLNSPGSFQGTLNVRDPRVQAADFLTQTNPNRTCLVVDYQGAIVWCGLIQSRVSTVSASASDTKQDVTIQAAELWSYFRQRIQATDYSAPPFSGINPGGMPWWTATPWDATLIAAQVISDAIGYSDSLIAFNGNPLGGLSILIEGVPPNPTSPLSSSFVAVTYPFTSTQTVDTIVTQLSALPWGTGFDFGIDVGYSNGTGTPPVGTVNISYPRRGRAVADNNLILDVSTARTYSFPEDGSQTANTVYEIGGSGAIVVDENVFPLDAGYPVLERVMSRSNAQSQSILSLLGQAGLSDLTLLSWAPVAPSVTVGLFGPDPQLGQFIVGDDIRVIVPALAGDGSVFDPRFPSGLDQEWRIVGWQATIPDEGDPTLTLTLNTPPPQTLPQSPPIASNFTPTATPPVNTIAPTITGIPVQGSVLSVTVGSWTGNPLTYTYQWQDCDSNGQNAANITGATSSSYTLAAGDVGFTIRCNVTAYNSGGAGSQQTAATAIVTANSVPVNTAPPTITGTVVQGQVLTASTGTWAASPSSFAYQWFSAGVAVGGATSSTYTLQSTDVGHTINVQVIASNANGASLPASSAPTVPVVAQSAPVNTVLPKITGTTVQGGALSVNTGTWSASPAVTSYAYQWYQVPTSSAAAFVQVKGTGNGSSSPMAAITFNSNVTAGNQILVFTSAKISAGAPTVSSVTGGGTYAHLGSVTGFGNTFTGELWWCSNATGGSTTGPTISWTGSGFQTNSLEAIAIEVSGLSAVDNSQVLGASGNSAAPTSATLTPTINGDFAVVQAWLSGLATATPGGVANSGWTDNTGAQSFNSNINPWDYQILPSTTAVTPAWAQAANYWATLGALFKTTSSSPTVIGGATSSTYTPVAGDVGKSLTATVVATNAVGSSSPATATATQTITASGNQPVSTFTDTFPGAALTAQWTTLFGSPTVASNTLTLPCVSGNGTFIASASPYNLTGSAIYMLITPPPIGTGSKITSLSLDPVQTVDSGNHILVNFDGTNVNAWKKVAGVGTLIASHASAGGTPLWVRIRESSGTVFWDYSSNAATWTNLASAADPIAVTSLYVILGSDYTGTESASNATVQDVNVQPASSPVPGPYQTLVWSDEFTGTALDATKWAILNSSVSGTQGVGGGIQFVTDSAHVAVGNFTLPDNSTANCLRLATTSATSAAWIQTNQNYDGTTNAGAILAAFDHGTALARIWMPPGEAMWPSFWMLNTTKQPKFGANQDPEIDHVEMLMGTSSNHSDFTVYQSTHFPSNTGLTQTFTLSSSAAAGWHTYGATWSSATGNVTFYVDGVQTHTSNGNTILSPPNNLWYLILVCGPGWSGSWPGAPPSNETYPQNMFIDWVRVYQ